MDDSTHPSYALIHAVNQPDAYRRAKDAAHQKATDPVEQRRAVEAAEAERTRVRNEQEAVREVVHEGYAKMKEDVSEQRLDRLKNELKDLHTKARMAAATNDADEARALSQKVAATMSAMRSAASSLRATMKEVNVPGLDDDATQQSLRDMINTQAMESEDPSRDVAEARMLASRIFEILRGVRAEDEEHEVRKNYTIARAQSRTKIQAFIAEEFGGSDSVIVA